MLFVKKNGCQLGSFYLQCLENYRESKLNVLLLFRKLSYDKARYFCNVFEAYFIFTKKHMSLVFMQSLMYTHVYCVSESLIEITKWLTGDSDLLLGCT